MFRPVPNSMVLHKLLGGLTLLLAARLTLAVPANAAQQQPANTNQQQTTTAAPPPQDPTVTQQQAQQAATIADQSKKKKKKKGGAAAPAPGPRKFDYDYTKLVWPNPPSLPRVKYVTFLTGMKIDYTPAKQQKQSWMDRVAGAQTETEKFNPKTYPFQLLRPYGMAIDSEGQLYVADQRVGAIFIFNTTTKDTRLIANGREAHFGLINAVAIDDSDRLFVSDGQKHRILIFNAKHEVENQITDVVDPVGLAIDNENRFLYVADSEQDQVLVFDADTLKLMRRIGTGGKNHELTSPGDFSKPQGVALDKEENLYVTDTMNDRVEIFDADGNFISTFGQNGDGPADFTRPKGIALDSDGHIWVADTVQGRVKVYNREGQLLTYIGSGMGELPGQFKVVMGVTVDNKRNLVFVSDQEPGRIQVFRYITDAEADVEKAKREAEMQKKADERNRPATSPATTIPSSGAAAPKPN